MLLSDTLVMSLVILRPCFVPAMALLHVALLHTGC